MESFAAAWPRLSRKFAGRHLLVLLDYDGTLTPIRATPGQAVLADKVRRQLRRLSARTDATVGIVSGRDYGDLRRKVGLAGLIYASNHGFKIQGKGVKYQVAVPAAARKAFVRFRRQLAVEMRGIAGVLVEKKKYSFALHYRLAHARDLGRIKECFQRLFLRYEACGLVVKPGKKVLEVMPALKWDKGRAVLMILSAMRAAHGRGVVPVYIGDDATDEYAFAALRGKGVTVHIGTGKRSCARYSLPAPQAVFEFLKGLRAE